MKKGGLAGQWHKVVDWVLFQSNVLRTLSLLDLSFLELVVHFPDQLKTLFDMDVGHTRVAVKHKISIKHDLKQVQTES